jgi:hypothetical protein
VLSEVNLINESCSASKVTPANNNNRAVKG